jgi:rRNA processing protein Krr1/Pno1
VFFAHNTITIFLIEITKNKRFISYYNPSCFSNPGGVSIEMSLAKDESLTVVIHGKQEDVMKARRMVVSQLQTQASIAIPIPREHHRFLLGKNGRKLQELELTTATKISIPRPEDNSDMVRIIGTKEGIDKARHEIQITSDEQVKTIGTF